MATRKPKKKKTNVFVVILKTLLLLVLVGILAVLAVFYFGGYYSRVKAMKDEADTFVSESTKETFVPTQTGEIYDAEGNLVVKMPNTVTLDNCSHNHAEMNAIRVAEEKLGTYDLGPFNLKLYTTSEPCSMCMGGIMWSGIREVYYGVPSESVERITGFDEGFKPGWLEEFKKRGITVYGNIERELGEQALRNYMEKGGTIYQPQR